MDKKANKKEIKKSTSFSFSETNLLKLKLLADAQRRKYTEYLEILIEDTFEKSGLKLPEQPTKK